MNTHLNDLIKQVLESELEVKEKRILLNELRKLLAPEQNRWNFRYVIWTLALIALSIPILAFWTYQQNKPVEMPDGLLSLGSAAVGALAAFLSPFSRKNDLESSKQIPVDVPETIQKLEARIRILEELKNKMLEEGKTTQ